MIIPLTANPSVDRTIEVAALRPGTVIRARASRVDAGGKGVNVARAPAAHGRKAKAVPPSGGAAGAPLAGLVAGAGRGVRPRRLARATPAELPGRSIDTIGDVVGAAGRLTARGVHTVLTSLGPAGAVLVRRDAAWHATAAALEPRSTVGAGDALLAGYLAAGADGPGALREAVAWGSAAAALPGSRMPGPGDISYTGIHITDLTAPARGDPPA